MSNPNRPLIVSQNAERDLTQAFNWYESQSLGLGDEFLAEVRAIIQIITRFPEMYAVSYRNVRRAGTPRFPYVVYYYTTSTRTEILGVMHASRSPNSWP